jgi:hypothetical protein
MSKESGVQRPQVGGENGRYVNLSDDYPARPHKQVHFSKQLTHTATMFMRLKKTHTNVVSRRVLRSRLFRKVRCAKKEV